MLKNFREINSSKNVVLTEKCSSFLENRNSDHVSDDFSTLCCIGIWKFSVHIKYRRKLCFILMVLILKESTRKNHKYVNFTFDIGWINQLHGKLAKHLRRVKFPNPHTVNSQNSQCTKITKRKIKSTIVINFLTFPNEVQIEFPN